MSLFADRTEAGRRLAVALGAYRGRDVVVLALPRGGVAVAAEVAKGLRAPLDLIMVRKIGAPGQPELAVGAVVEGEPPFRAINSDVVRLLDVDEAFLSAEEQRQVDEIARRRQLYLGHVRRVPLKGRIAVIVDDGVATGATMRAALHAVREAGATRVVVAVPVAPSETLARLETEADEVVCLEQPSWFRAIGLHYADFRQLTDDDVIALLEEVGHGTP